MVLVHSRTGLADPELLPSVRQEAKEILLQKGVELLLGTCTHLLRGGVTPDLVLARVNSRLCVTGQKVSNLSELQLNVTRKDTLVTLERGDHVTTDLIICCTGLKVNCAAYSSSLRKTDTHECSLLFWTLNVSVYLFQPSLVLKAQCNI